MPSGFLPGLRGTPYLVGSIIVLALAIVLAILTFTGVIGGGILLGILWIVVALAAGVAVMDASRKG